MQTIKLGKLALNIIDYRGKSVPKSDRGVPLITARNIRQGFIDFKEKEFISSENFVDWASKGFPAAGDVLITSEAPLGMVALFPEGEYAIGQRVICIQPNHQLVDSKYLMYQLLSESGQRKLYKLSSGSTALGIKQSELKKIEVLLLPLEDQKKIAQILSTWDEAIEAVEILIEKKQKLFRSLTLLFFDNFDSKQAVKLKELGSFSKGKGVSKSEVKANGIPCVRYGELYTEYATSITKTASFIDEESASSATKINYGDILFAGSGESSLEIGKSAIFLLEEGYAGGDTIIFSPDSRKVDGRYLSFQLASPYQISQRAKLAQGHSVVHIYKSHLENMKIILPDIELQKDQAKTLENVEMSIFTLTEKRKLLEKQKKGIMQILLTGEVRVS